MNKLVIVMILLCSTIIQGNESRPTEKNKEVQKDLPNVLLLGDSISLGYTNYVRQKLAGRANVYRAMTSDGKSVANCGNTKMGLAGLDHWLDTKQIKSSRKQWDVIHFNWGLWDINRRIPKNQDNLGVRDREKGFISFTEEEYAANLTKIVKRLQKTNAKLIWANISFVPQGEEGRRFGDDLLYNQTAEKVMKSYNIPINDLNTFTRSLGPDLMAKPGDVHYKSEGYRKIAEQVVKIIEKQLP